MEENFGDFQTSEVFSLQVSRKSLTVINVNLKVSASFNLLKSPFSLQTYFTLVKKALSPTFIAMVIFIL